MTEPDSRQQHSDRCQLFCRTGAKKTISNYLDHLAPISIDAVFQPEVH